LAPVPPPLGYVIVATIPFAPIRPRSGDG
jgi:hypothetical protein